jgi:hypothetical protein
MQDHEAEITQLKPRQESPVRRINETAGGEEPRKTELERSSEEMNRATVRRITENEATRCPPILEQAILDAQRGRQLYSMAAFAQDNDTQRELADVLERLAAAAMG